MADKTANSTLYQPICCSICFSSDIIKIPTSRITYTPREQSLYPPPPTSRGQAFRGGRLFILYNAPGPLSLTTKHTKHTKIKSI